MQTSNKFRVGITRYIITNSNNLLSGVVSFFFNDTATTDIYTLSLHDALPICSSRSASPSSTSRAQSLPKRSRTAESPTRSAKSPRSEEHTSELQSPDHLVCRLLLEKKKDALTDISISMP